MRSNFGIDDRYINMSNRYITMTQGDTLSFGIRVRDQYGELLDINSAVFVCKKTYTAAESVFEKTLNDGISRLDDGEYVVRVAPADTENAAAGKYHYNLRVGLNEDVFTALSGIIEIVPRVTD